MHWTDQWADRLTDRWTGCNTSAYMTMTAYLTMNKVKSTTSILAFHTCVNNAKQRYVQ